MDCDGDIWWECEDGLFTWGDTAEEAEARSRKMTREDAEREYGQFALPEWLKAPDA
jgi:hypothetical protein